MFKNVIHRSPLNALKRSTNCRYLCYSENYTKAFCLKKMILLTNTYSKNIKTFLKKIYFLQTAV